MLCPAEEVGDEIDTVPALMDPVGMMTYLLECDYMPDTVLPSSHVLTLDLYSNHYEAWDIFTTNVLEPRFEP